MSPVKRICVFEHPTWQILTAHAQPFRGARDLAFCLKVPLDSLLVWASSGGSGETARMRRLAWTFAARIGDKYQIRLTRPICEKVNRSLMFSVDRKIPTIGGKLGKPRFPLERWTLGLRFSCFHWTPMMDSIYPTIAESLMGDAKLYTTTSFLLYAGTNTSRDPSLLTSAAATSPTVPSPASCIVVLV